MKRIIITLVLIFALLSGMGEEAFAASKYGFNYDESNGKVKWAGYFKVNVTQNNVLLGSMSYYVGVQQLNNSNEYILMTKEVMTPTEYRENGKLKLKGLSEYVSVKTTLPSLDNYTPQNTPATDSFSITAGANASGGTISASYSIKHNDLKITSKCDTPKKLFYIEYDYLPSIINIFADNTYVANESAQYGMAEFTKTTGNKNSVGLYMQYDARFGVATTENCTPVSILTGVVYKKTDSRAYNIYF